MGAAVPRPSSHVTSIAVLSLVAIAAAWVRYPLHPELLGELVFLGVFTQALSLISAPGGDGHPELTGLSLSAVGLAIPGPAVGLVVWVCTYQRRTPGARLLGNHGARALLYVATSVATPLLTPSWAGLPGRALVFSGLALALDHVVAGLMDAAGNGFWESMRRRADPASVWTALLLRAGGAILVLLLSVPEGYFVSLLVAGFVYSVQRNLRDARRLSRVWTEAQHDPLTNLLNRRGLAEQARRLTEGPARNRPLAVVMLDLDHFKQVNDLYGHDAGDRVLAAAGELLRLRLRLGDLAVRLGGEEFCLVLVGLDGHGAAEVAERVRRQVSGLEVLPERRRLTISAGVAAGPSRRFEELLREADAALYRAKREGRDRVSIAHPRPGTMIASNGQEPLSARR